MKASVLHLLRTKVLLHRDRVVGPSLDRRVVRHDHHQSPAHRADARHHAARRHRFVAVQVVAGERGELKEGRAGVEEGLDALPREHLAACRVQRPRARATALVCHRCRRANLYQLLVHPRGVREERGARGVDRAIEHRRSCRTRAQQPTASRTHNRRAQRLHDPERGLRKDRRQKKFKPNIYYQSINHLLYGPFPANTRPLGVRALLPVAPLRPSGPLGALLSSCLFCPAGTWM